MFSCFSFGRVKPKEVELDKEELLLQLNDEVVETLSDIAHQRHALKELGIILCTNGGLQPDVVQTIVDYPWKQLLLKRQRYLVSVALRATAIVQGSEEKFEELPEKLRVTLLCLKRMGLDRDCRDMVVKEIIKDVLESYSYECSVPVLRS